MTGQLALLDRHVRRIVRRARWRYWSLDSIRRPSLTGPSTYLGLFSRTELLELARLGTWPLPLHALSFMAERPTKQRRQQRRFRRRVEDSLARALAVPAKRIAFRRLLFSRDGETHG
jgi:hypothetical protein